MLNYEIGDLNILLWSSKAYLKWFMISIPEAKFEVSILLTCESCQSVAGGRTLEMSEGNAHHARE